MIYQLFTTAVKFALLISYKILDAIDQIVTTAAPTAAAWAGKQETCEPRSSACEEQNEMKRIKLLLDISVTPGPSGVVVSSTKVTNISTSSSFLSKLFWLPAFCWLKVSLTARRVLNILENIAESETKDNDDGDISMKTEGSGRKIISPRKRIKKSKSLLTHFWPNFFPFTLVKFSRSRRIVFEIPTVELPNDDSESNPRLKSVEKRKRTSSGSDYESTSNSSSSRGSPNNVLSNGHHSSSENVGGDNVDHNGQHISGNSSVKKDLFAVEEGYKSSEDPDYSVGSEESSSSEYLDEEGELEHSSEAENSDADSISASSPVSSTTGQFPANESNRRCSIVLDGDTEDLMNSVASPKASQEFQSSFSSPGEISAIDSPNSTTSNDSVPDADHNQ